MQPHERIVLDYAERAERDPDCGLDEQAAARRYLRDLDSGRWDFRPQEAEMIIMTIEQLFCHQQGEDLCGRPLRGKPFLLQPWQLFSVYNIFGFYLPGTDLRRYLEAFFMLARKNGKTPFVTAMNWAAALKYCRSFSKVKTVAGSLQQNMEGFRFLSYNLHRLGLTVNEDPIHGLRVLDSSLGHSFSGPIWDGMVSFDALAFKPELFDSFNGNIVHLDELELYKNATPYTRLGDSTKAYRNKLICCTTTAGDNGVGFCAQRTAYVSKIVRGEITGPDADRVFGFIARADPDPETGKLDFMSPRAWKQANPSWGVTISPEDMEAMALRAQNDPQTRGEFITRSLNNFISQIGTWFDMQQLMASDQRYDWTQRQLTKLVSAWYGGADLSRLQDLTAACIVGEVPAAKAATPGWTPPEDVLVIIPHCWFPLAAASEKANKDNIPLFGWMDDGWLDMPNTASMNPEEPVKQFVAWRNAGFKIRKVGHDRKYARKYITAMKKAKFTVVDQPQLVVVKNEGFRYIEHKAAIGCLYVCHAEPWLYCAGNVYGKELASKNDIVEYEKINDTSRIDVFDASVFAVVRMLADTDRVANINAWFASEQKGADDGEG